MAIHQDYLIRMIQEIISLLVAALMNKRKIREKEWESLTLQKIEGFIFFALKSGPRLQLLPCGTK